eukprot:TRINITY_DN8195_c0_g3_i1.p1 TRINITY_DN8195_c0_g3~~TRINITY_DN8195_c0_g3_i1.p1  ORF type:complete len:452 (+),score=75.63 TRINITY_DN8195_c0_g3_i1:57-1412(+)
MVVPVNGQSWADASDDDPPHRSDMQVGQSGSSCRTVASSSKVEPIMLAAPLQRGGEDESEEDRAANRSCQFENESSDVDSPCGVADALLRPSANSAGRQRLQTGRKNLPSPGSKLHMVGRCKPCAFLHTKGCQQGHACTFCHLCPPRERLRRKRLKQQLSRSIKTNLGPDQDAAQYHIQSPQSSSSSSRGYGPKGGHSRQNSCSSTFAPSTAGSLTASTAEVAMDEVWQVAVPVSKCDSGVAWVQCSEQQFASPVYAVHPAASSVQQTSSNQPTMYYQPCQEQPWSYQSYHPHQTHQQHPLPHQQQQQQHQKQHHKQHQKQRHQHQQHRQQHQHQQQFQASQQMQQTWAPVHLPGFGMVMQPVTYRVGASAVAADPFRSSMPVHSLTTALEPIREHLPVAISNTVPRQPSFRRASFREDDHDSSEDDADDNDESEDDEDDDGESECGGDAV